MIEYPTVSIIIPCLDKTKDKHLRNCLFSIYASEYPKDKIQILIKEGMIAEDAKGEALKEATGEYVMFLDSDNELLPNYLERAIRALQERHYAFGVEANYEETPKNSLNNFLTNLLHISDPISLLISSPPRITSQHPNNAYYSCTFSNNSFAYPLGANGFVYRRCDLDKVQASCDFEDTQIPLRMLKAGFLCWLRVSGPGVKHHYVNNLWEFFLKRRRQTFHYLVKKEKKLNTINWTMLRPRQPIWLAWLYCVSIIGPVFTAFYQTNRLFWAEAGNDVFPKEKYKAFYWLWWPPACFVSALGLVAGIVTYYFSKFFSVPETSLQPKRA